MIVGFTKVHKENVHAERDGKMTFKEEISKDLRLENWQLEGIIEIYNKLSLDKQKVKESLERIKILCNQGGSIGRIIIENIEKVEEKILFGDSK